MHLYNRETNVPETWESVMWHPEPGKKIMCITASKVLSTKDGREKGRHYITESHLLFWC
jgi:hypothetical protein